jgi:outer membrane murein-binding lipoprotein Lpp
MDTIRRVIGSGSSEDNRKLEAMSTEIRRLHGDLDDISRQLQESRSREKALEAQLNEKAREVSECHWRLQQSNAAPHDHQEHHTEILYTHNDHNRLINDVSRLSATIDALKKENEGYQNQVLSARQDLENARYALQNQQPLDVYGVSADQVSEAFVLSSSPYSIDTINNAVDTMIQDVLMKFEQSSKPLPQSRSRQEEVTNHDNHLIMKLLRTTSVDDDTRGLLLDVMFHHVIFQRLYKTFFSSTVLPVNLGDADKLISKIFSQLQEQGKHAGYLLRSIVNYSLHKSLGVRINDGNRSSFLASLPCTHMI